MKIAMLYSRFASSVENYKSMNIILEEDLQLGHGALWLGDYQAASDVSNLKQKGIKTVLCVAAGLNIKYPVGSGIKQKVYNILDIESANISKLFNDTYNQISEGLQSGGVLVHCAAGVSRSSSTIIAYLIRKMKISFNEAFNFVKKRRSVINPNQGFQRQLKIFEKELKSGQLSLTATSGFQQQTVLESSTKNIKTIQESQKNQTDMSTNNNFISIKMPDQKNLDQKNDNLFQNSSTGIKRDVLQTTLNQSRLMDKILSAQKSVGFNQKYLNNKLRSNSTNYRNRMGLQSQQPYKPQIVTYNQRNQLQDSKLVRGPISLQGYQYRN